MRRLDRWVGALMCRLLTWWRRAASFLRRESPAGDGEEKILFIKLAEMGAIVLALPAFEAARRRVGRDKMFCVMLEGNREIHGLIDVFPQENLITIRDRGLWSFAVDCLRLMRRCRREGIDTVIDFEGFTRISAVLSYLSGASRRVGMHRFTTEGPYRGDLFTHRVAHNPSLHTSAQFLAMVEALDADPADVPLVKQRVTLPESAVRKFEPRPDEVDAVGRLLSERFGGLPPRPWIVLNPNLIDLLPLRSWPRENYAVLGRRLLDEQPTATLLLIGLADERHLSAQLAAEISADRAASLAGDTSLRSLVTLLTMADLLITSDSGPAHMASLTEISVIALFGPETPRLYAPLGPRQKTICAELACSPCFSALNYRRSACTNNVCMRAITVEQVMRAVHEVCPALSKATEDRQAAAARTLPETPLG